MDADVHNKLALEESYYQPGKSSTGKALSSWGKLPPWGKFLPCLSKGRTRPTGTKNTVIVFQADMEHRGQKGGGETEGDAPYEKDLFFRVWSRGQKKRGLWLAQSPLPLRAKTCLKGPA